MSLSLPFFADRQHDRQVPQGAATEGAARRKRGIDEDAAHCERHGQDGARVLGQHRKGT